MAEAFPSYLLQEMLTLFVGGAPAAGSYRVNLAGHVHAAAALEDLARRCGPRTAREYSERDWMRQCLDPDVLAANVAAWNEYRARTSPAPKRAPARRSLAKWRLGMDLALGGHDA